MTQLSLFPPQASPASVAQIEAQTKHVRRELARRTDPQTSHLAAEQLDLPRAQQYALDAAKSLMETQSDVTAREVGEAAEQMFGGDRETYRKRLLDLWRRDLLEETTVRPCRITGKQAQAYRVVKGKA